jgi:hypothetical protein
MIKLVSWMAAAAFATVLLNEARGAEDSDSPDANASPDSSLEEVVVTAERSGARHRV